MATPAELASERTGLDEAELAHLQRLLGTWGILADLSFSDLVLLAPITHGGGARPEPGWRESTVAESTVAESTVAVSTVAELTVPEEPTVLGDRSDPAELAELAELANPDSNGAGTEGPRIELVILGQMRPSNSATVVQHDLVGQTMGAVDWPPAVAAVERGETTRGEVQLEPGEEPVRLHCIPVRFLGNTITVLARLTSGTGRRPGHLERTYRDLFDRFALMLTESTFPFPSEEVATEEAPRVGDGIVLVDEEARVRFSSPNATNALHRMGMYSQVEGRRLSDLGIEESAIEWALASSLPVVEEVERRPDVTVLLHCVPLIAHGHATGCLVLLRDVTDVRRLDRLLLSKDAAIREVHHRVKNNLQTISALLGLQARRLPHGDGRVALFEAERRVRSIALVHEILSREPSDQVPFDEIVESLIQMAKDSVVEQRPIEFEVRGQLGEVAAEVATPLAVVLAELLQNAVEHAFVDDSSESGGSSSEGSESGGSGSGGSSSEGSESGSEGGWANSSSPGHIMVKLRNDGRWLILDVIDDGCGLPAGFDIEATQSLGLSIVRDLIRSQLSGTITMRNRSRVERGDRGTIVTIVISAADGQLTSVS